MHSKPRRLHGPATSEAEQGIEPDGQAPQLRHLFYREEDAWHERAPVHGVVAYRQRLAGGAEEDFLVGDQAPQAH